MHLSNIYTGVDNFQLMSVHRDCCCYNYSTMYSAGHDTLTLDKENKLCLLHFLRDDNNTLVELTVALFHCVPKFSIVKLRNAYNY